MVSISIHELSERSEDVMTELRAGHTLELIQGGKRIGEIVPSSSAPTDEERRLAWKSVIEFMEQGLDLGGVPCTREEMHER